MPVAPEAPARVTKPVDPIRAHERQCPVCKARGWCETVMEMIAKKRLERKR